VSFSLLKKTSKASTHKCAF